MNGCRYATARFMTRADLTTCGRNIFPEPKRSPTTRMPSINGPSITSSGRAASRRASSVSSSTKSTIPRTSACSRRFPTGDLAPRQVDLALGAGAAHVLGQLDEPLGRIGPPVEEHVLDALLQLRLDVLVHSQLARVHDPHVEPGPDRVVEERRVHRLTNDVVPAEREAEVRDSAGRVDARATLLDQRQALDERERVAVVLLECRSRRRARSGRR